MGSEGAYSTRSGKLTGDGTSTAATTVVIDNYCIALHNPVYSEVAAKACVGDLSVLETLDGQLYRVHSRASGSQGGHGDSRSTVLN